MARFRRVFLFVRKEKLEVFLCIKVFMGLIVVNIR